MLLFVSVEFRGRSEYRLSRSSTVSLLKLMVGRKESLSPACMMLYRDGYLIENDEAILSEVLANSCEVYVGLPMVVEPSPKVIVFRGTVKGTVVTSRTWQACHVERPTKYDAFLAFKNVEEKLCVLPVSSAFNRLIRPGHQNVGLLFHREGDLAGSRLYSLHVYRLRSFGKGVVHIRCGENHELNKRVGGNDRLEIFHEARKSRYSRDTHKKHVCNAKKVCYWREAGNLPAGRSGRRDFAEKIDSVLFAA